MDARLAELLGPTIAARAVCSHDGRVCRWRGPVAWQASRREDAERTALLGRLFARFAFRAACLNDERAAAVQASEALGVPTSDGPARWAWFALDLSSALQLAAEAEGAWAMVFAQQQPALRVIVPVLVGAAEAAARVEALGVQALLVSEIDDEAWLLALCAGPRGPNDLAH